MSPEKRRSGDVNTNLFEETKGLTDKGLNEEGILAAAIAHLE